MDTVPSDFVLVYVYPFTAFVEMMLKRLYLSLDRMIILRL